jgi:hypothetical protein
MTIVLKFALFGTREAPGIDFTPSASYNVNNEIDQSAAKSV